MKILLGYPQSGKIVDCTCILDRSCAVTTQEQCPDNTTLVSVGRRGRPECAQGLKFLLGPRYRWLD